MGKTIDQLTALGALADGDLLVVDDISETDTRKMTASQLITYIEGEEIDNPQFNEAVAMTATSTELNSGCDGMGVSIPRQKVLEIGDWNMDSSLSVAVAHGLTLAKIIGVRGIIRDDAGTTHYPITQMRDYAACEVAITHIDATNVNLTRNGVDFFDSASFDSTSYNRGWLVVDYID